MREIGFVTLKQLGEAQRQGLDPKACVDRIIAEAKARYPDVAVVDIRRQADGFAVVAL